MDIANFSSTRVDRNTDQEVTVLTTVQTVLTTLRSLEY